MSAFRPRGLAAQRLAGGVLGRKTGRGFYDYRDGAERPPAKSAVAQGVPDTIVLHGDSAAGQALAGRLPGVQVDATLLTNGDLPDPDAPPSAWLACLKAYR